MVAALMNQIGTRFVPGAGNLRPVMWSVLSGLCVLTGIERNKLLLLHRVGRRLHVEFPCPHDPIANRRPTTEHLRDIAANELARARRTLEDACRADNRFASLV